jgi:hypothetical protein
MRTEKLRGSPGIDPVGALAALRRARQRAERLALMTGTCLVVVEDGKTIRVPPRAAAHRGNRPALGGRARDLVRRKA